MDEAEIINFFNTWLSRSGHLVRVIPEENSFIYSTWGTTRLFKYNVLTKTEVELSGTEYWSEMNLVGATSQLDLTDDSLLVKAEEDYVERVVSGNYSIPVQEHRANVIAYWGGAGLLFLVILGSLIFIGRQ